MNAEVFLVINHSKAIFLRAIINLYKCIKYNILEIVGCLDAKVCNCNFVFVGIRYFNAVNRVNVNLCYYL